MQGQVIWSAAISNGRVPLLALPPPPSPSAPFISTVSSSRISHSLKFRGTANLKRISRCIRPQASNVGIGLSSYDERGENDEQKTFDPLNESSLPLEKPPNQIPYPLSIAMVLAGCALVFSLLMFVKGGTSSIWAAIAKSGFTAAFTLIFVSEIGDKTFFIAALLAMQYKKGLVLLGSMAALSLMSILSVIIGRVFNSVPALFQTSKLPVSDKIEIVIVIRSRS